MQSVLGHRSEVLWWVDPTMSTEERPKLDAVDFILKAEGRISHISRDTIEYRSDHEDLCYLDHGFIAIFDLSAD